MRKTSRHYGAGVARGEDKEGDEVSVFGDPQGGSRSGEQADDQRWSGRGCEGSWARRTQ